MGNSASSSRGHQDETVDYGFLVPQGVYSGVPDWNHQIVTQLIIDRRLAPLYRPLEDYDDNWDDEQILAARKPLPETSDVATSDSAIRSEHPGPSPTPSRHGSQYNRRPGALKEPSRLPEAMVYRGATECPICFLYYPPNINRSRCCDQAICTECFVQIKRGEPTATHLVSEPAACPYCVQENFGVTYDPPSWRAGIGAENIQYPTQSTSRPTIQSTTSGRRKSFGADSPEVVTIDQIRPDWEAKLAAVRAAVARRANRRIIMRQVGDRLIPVGVTSGRIHPLGGVEVATATPNADENGSSIVQEGRMNRRQRRRQQQDAEAQQNRDLNQLLGTMGLGGQDLEELMLMEAMRLSTIEYEEQQKKEAEEKKKKQAGKAASGQSSGDSGPSSSASAGPVLPPIPIAKPINVGMVRELGSASRSSSSGRPSLSSENRSSPVDSSVGENSSPLSNPQGSSPSTAPIHSWSGSATPNLREVTLRKSLDASLPILPGSSSDDIHVLSAKPTPPAVEGSHNPLLASDSIHGPTSTTTPPSALQKTVEAIAVPVLGRTETSASVATMASELTGGGPTYAELPSSPDSPENRPLLLETPASEVAEPVMGSSCVPEGK